MTPERWQQVKSTLAAALEQPDEKERAAFLANACADDTALRREVESLLEQPEDEFDSVAQVIGVAIADPLSSANVGRRIGAYELVRELGRGGMGTVWLARRADQQFEKLVAIKLLKRGTDTDEVLRRFRAERQILARLEHPNIARLLDGGMTDDGLPYFVMEYVEGKPLTEFCRLNVLTIEERLRLFLKICAAVQFAHQNLVVHRDLKPGNILVTEDCEPKLLDFGIAKLLAPGGEALEVTMNEHQRLTPAYASPEQVRGEPVTTVSDIYTLGTLLYETLTGQNAHRFSTPHPPPTELLRVVTQEEPLRPSAAATDVSTKRRLRGDLDNIILKALRKESGRRYAGIGSFSEDIQRHLENRPVIARKDTFSYRASKFVQRNKIVVAAAALIVLTLIGGIIGTAWEARRANRRFNDVRRLAHSVLFDYHDAIADLPGSTAVREKLVKDSLEYLDSLAQEGGSDASLQREIASAYLKVGDVQGRPNFANLGDTAGALASYLKALNLREQLAAAEPGNTELHLELAGTYTRIGEVLRNQGDLSRAVESNRKAVAVMENLAAHASSAEVGEALALAYVTLGDVLGNPYTANLGDTNGASESYRRALAIREKLMADDPASAEKRKWTATSHQRLGNMLQTINDTAGALENYRLALAIDETLLKEDPTNTFAQRNVGIDYQLLSMALVDAGDLNQAREFQAKNIAIWERMAQADPKNAVAQSDLSLGYSRMVAVLAKSGDAAGALTYYQKSLAIVEGLLAKDPKNVTHLMTLRGNYLRMADLLLTTGDVNGVLEDAGKELAIDDQILAINPASADARRNQALAHAQLGKAYMLLASNTRTTLMKQRQNWRAAGSEYQKSLDIWQDIKNQGTLSVADAGKPDELAKEVANCDAALNSIEGAKTAP
jgi:non-specific serine/threonine protein kinase/serine/threonine-protein kinase